MIRRCHTIALGAIALAFGLTGCQSNYEAPVVEGWHQQSEMANRYRVQKGDTLYSIAFAYDQDYRVLAAENHIAPTDVLRVGQWLRMTKPGQLPRPVKAVTVKRQSRYHVAKPGLYHRLTASPERHRAAPSSRAVHPVHHHPVRELRSARFHASHCPAKGKIISSFTGTYTGNKGIDISGHYNTPVRAVASGVVVYRGQGVRGYPQLIILKHNRHYLSAYANNAKILVRQGQTVHAGQLIARMGRDHAGRTRLHFELRRRGLSVNPKYLLPRTCVNARR